MKHSEAVYAIFIILLSACGQNAGSRQDRPVSTDAVLDYQRYCHYWMWERAKEINEKNARCQSEYEWEYCRDLAEELVAENNDYWFTCLDDLPMVSEECRMQLDHADPLHDTDGDGVSDYMESFMSLNPCEVCSYGGTEGVDCDADLDFDGDGTPNGEDDSPGCGMGEGEFQNCIF